MHAKPPSREEGELGARASPVAPKAGAGRAPERIDDWRAFLEQGLDPDDHATLRAAERTGRFP